MFPLHAKPQVGAAEIEATQQAKQRVKLDLVNFYKSM
jgi:hypothetical protein